MNTTMANKVNDHTTLTGKIIYIIGPRQLQNELMISFLAEHTGAKCLAGEDMQHVESPGTEGDRQPKIILLDCLDKDPDGLLLYLDSDDDQILKRHFVALFNLNPNLKIEERALAFGVRGFFYKHDPLELIPKGVQAIFKGELWLSRKIMTKYILESRSKVNIYNRTSTVLTHREVDILALVAVGASNDEIADKLCISPNTVKTHIYNIFKKIKVTNRLQAALWAAQNL